MFLPHGIYDMCAKFMLFDKRSDLGLFDCGDFKNKKIVLQNNLT